MDSNPWQMLDGREYNAVWDRFEREFSFCPRMNRAEWPSIQEPSGSFTLSLETVATESNERGSADSLLLRSWFLSGLKSAGLHCERWLALDWQHGCYAVFPDKLSENDVEADWPVTVFPDGDYSIFATEDFRVGYFGHPWELSACVWGQPLTDALPLSIFPYPTLVMRQN